MRILILSEYFPSTREPAITGGVEARAWYLTRFLATRHDVVVITSWRPHLPRVEEIDGVMVFRVGCHHPYSNENQIISRFYFALAAYKKGLSLSPFDIVDGQNFITYLPAHMIARNTGAKAIATYHEVWCGHWVHNKGFFVGSLGELWERLSLAKEWDHLVAVSQYTANKLVQKGVSGDKITIIHNGVDFGLINRIETGPRKPKTICMVSRLVEGKRPELFLEALDIIQKTRPQLMQDVSVKICGDGPLMNDCKRLASQLGLWDKVSFLGRLESLQDVYKLMKESALLVHPSKIEGFGIVVAEATACGTPVLVADIPPSREVLAIIGGGRLFRPDTADRLAAEIINHFESEPIPVGNPNALRWETLGEKVARLYSDILTDTC